MSEMTEADHIIDGLGGTSAVARLLNAPISTVHSWRQNGIPASRLAHLRLAAQAEGLRWPEDDVAAHGGANTSESVPASPGMLGGDSPCAIADQGAAA